MSEYRAELAWVLLSEKEKEDEVFTGARRVGVVAAIPPKRRLESHHKTKRDNYVFFIKNDFE